MKEGKKEGMREGRMEGSKERRKEVSITGFRDSGRRATSAVRRPESRDLGISECRDLGNERRATRDEWKRSAEAAVAHKSAEPFSG